VRPGPERDELIRSHVWLVESRAFKLAGRYGWAAEELLSIALIGLVDAADRWDGRPGVKFATYAQHRIDGEIVDGMRQLVWGGRMAQKEAGTCCSCARTFDDRELRPVMPTQRRGGRPRRSPVPEACPACGAPWPQQLEASRQRSVTSLEASSWENADDGDVIRIADALIGGDEPEVVLGRGWDIELVDNAVSHLPARQRTVCRLYFWRRLTMDQIGGMLGVTESRVCQIMGEAKAQLREELINVGAA